MDDYGAAGYGAGGSQARVKKCAKRRRGLILLLVLVAALSIMAEILATGLLLQRTACFLAGARAYRTAGDVVERLAWQAENGQLMSEGEEKIDGLTIVWRQEPSPEQAGGRMCVTASERLAGRQWSMTWRVYY